MLQNFKQERASASIETILIISFFSLMMVVLLAAFGKQIAAPMKDQENNMVAKSNNIYCTGKYGEKAKWIGDRNSLPTHSAGLDKFSVDASAVIKDGYSSGNPVCEY